MPGTRRNSDSTPKRTLVPGTMNAVSSAIATDGVTPVECKGVRSDFRFRGNAGEATVAAVQTDRGADMPDIKILNPDSLGKPLGQYSQITRVKAAEFLFIAGQVGASKDGKTPADFDGQCAQTF